MTDASGRIAVMESLSGFARVEKGLEKVLEELRGMEPIFHTAEFGRTAEDFDRRMAADYWEVGASGRRYSREFILQYLTENSPVSVASAGWTCSDLGLRRLGAANYLLTYTLRQEERVTRRATVWQQVGGGWQILFHQGTVVSAAEEDRIPA
jgi:hypothetical protein